LQNHAAIAECRFDFAAEFQPSLSSPRKSKNYDCFNRPSHWQFAAAIDCRWLWNRWKLEDWRGKTVVLLFYPGDETPVCTKQLCKRARQLGTVQTDRR